MKTSESILGITKAYMRCQEEFTNLSPDSTGFNYKYLSLHKLIDETKPILIKNGIVCMQSVGQTENGVSITTRLQHVSGEFFEDTFNLPPTNSNSMNDVQAMGSSISYGRRYGMSTMLGITVDDDNDGASSKGKTEKPQYSDNKKLDYNVVDKELMECETTEKINDYSKILFKEFPNMTDKQKESIKYKFIKRRKEIETIDNTKKEFQGEVFDDSNIPY